MLESLPSHEQWQGFFYNGNLTKDSNKNISNIAYNCLNLPNKVTFSDGSTITYSYAADGTKLRTVHTISGTTTQKDYCANVVYENGVQKMLLTEEGYVDLSASTPTYYYYLKDHQGNNRVVINSSGTVAEMNHYYPFGGVFASTGNVQPYKYNGKELDTKCGLNWYDYGARHYDATLGRFMTQDRFVEKYSALSPYQYGANNPVCNVDMNGDSISIADFLSLDKHLNCSYTSQILNDLQAQTGLMLSDKNGMLIYQKDQNGNPLINGGSKTARTLLIQSIEHKDVVTVVDASRSEVVLGSNELRLGIRQINKFIEGSVGVDNRTMGFGMTFLHELHHTQVGGGLKDTPGNLGPVVERMNIIRSELNVLKGNYGVRMNYQAIMIGERCFIPFDDDTKKRIDSEQLPESTSKYIIGVR